MKRHERCSIGGSSGKVEIPLLLSFLYYSVKRRAGRKLLDSGIKLPASQSGVIRSEDSVRRGFDISSCREAQSFPRSVGHEAMSSKNWFGPVKGYSLLDQMTSRNLLSM